MKRTSIRILSLLLAFARVIVATEPTTNPFQSVVAKDSVIVATLPEKGRWHVADGVAAARLSAPSEAFAIAVGTSLRLSERHTTYDFKATLAPEAGLSVNAVSDARSFGGEVTKSHYFIKAQ